MYMCVCVSIFETAHRSTMAMVTVEFTPLASKSINWESLALLSRFYSKEHHTWMGICQ